MSEHTPLTEAEVNALGPFIWGGWLGVDPEKHSDYAHDLLELVGKIKADALAARTSTATADTGLRERVEAVLLHLGARSTHGCSGAEVQATYHTELDAALATPASTEDRADNEGTVRLPDDETLAELLSWTSGDFTRYSDTACEDHNRWSWRGDGHGEGLRDLYRQAARDLREALKGDNEGTR